MLTANEETELLELLEDEWRSKCRDSFWAFCQFAVPRQYKADRQHLRELADTLQAFVEDRLKLPNGDIATKLMLNMPPRHGKTLTVENLICWMLGNSPLSSAIVVSYGDELSQRFAKYVRNVIQEEKANDSLTVFSDIFQGVKVKDGDGAVKSWSLEGSHFSFLATSPGSTITGTGAKFGVIDDLIKNAKEAFNARILEEHWDWYTNTYLSRLEAGAKQIVIMTRWSTGDLCGRLLAFEPDEWYVVKMPAFDGTKMLCDSILSHKEFLSRQRKTDPVIFAGNYQQEPFDSEDRLYLEFKTYSADTLPKDGIVEAYVDTADQGKDYLAAMVYRNKANLLYAMDVIYTQAPMETTEVQTARMLIENNCDRVWIESNNGGRGFARNVERIMREAGYTRCRVEWFHQSENKWARIQTNATTVTNCIIMPEGWHHRWPQFYHDVMAVSRMTMPEHDDAPDMLTGATEKSISTLKFEIY